MKKKTLEEFITQFKTKFGNKYTFEHAIYNGNKKLMTATCPIHGNFNIRPNDILSGHGCPVCGGTKKSNTEEFIRKANIVHNNYFTYEHCEYNGSNQKVIVTCPIHGNFEVKANNHLNGTNCKKCGLEGFTHRITKLPQINNSSKKLTTEEFIDKCKVKWGDKYTYEKTDYIKNNQKVIITCPFHSDFKVTPNHFLSGRGCPKCAKNQKKTTEIFIEELRTIHSMDEYDYSEVNYVNIHTPVKLRCLKCGCIFYNSPSNLLYYKQGCPSCNESHLENDIRTLLENNKINYENYKHFKWLGKQSLDFYLPDYNIGIECQGIQHFKPVEFFGSEKAFQKQIKNDEKKRILCEEKGINILYYSDKEYKCNYDLITNSNDFLNKILKR